MKLPNKKSNILAIICWVSSLILAFRISPHSRHIWIPDTLLLIGFWPLLIARRASWLWLVFGICNMVAGMTLALAVCIPDEFFVPYHLVEMNSHLKLYHPYMVWLLIGFLSALIGIIIITINLVVWCIGLYKRKLAKKSP